MVPYLFDENLSSAVWRSLRDDARFDAIRVQEIGLRTAKDEIILDWADENGRVLVTHDARTIPAAIKQRLFAHKRSRGVFLFQPDCGIGQMIEELRLISECSSLGDWNDQVVFLPL